MISLNIEKTFGFISKEKVSAYEAEVKAAQEMLERLFRLAALAFFYQQRTLG